MTRFLSLSIVIFSCVISFHAQLNTKNNERFVSAIGFWNVENLYDTLNDKWKNDEEFTPSGVNAWNGERYRTKIDRLAEVISLMAVDMTPDGLAMIGLCEIENKKVLEDLVNSPRIKKRNYQFVHIEGPDARGIDPALLYNPFYFEVKNAMVYHVKMVTDSNYKTRDILVVGGVFNGEQIVILVNHWPSRRGGELASRPNRIAAAGVVKKITDSILNSGAGIKIIVMGDFNDDPVNKSVKEGLNCYGNLNAKNKADFYNPMEQPFREGTGTLAWQDSWNLFDQVLLNQPWVNGSNSWQYHSVRIYNKQFLRTDYGNFKGYPFRTYSGGTYTAGYSDHFPVYVLITKNKN